LVANTLISENEIIGKMIKPVSKDKFYKLEHKNMDIAFSIQKELCHFCDEKFFRPYNGTILTIIKPYLQQYQNKLIC